MPTWCAWASPTCSRPNRRRWATALPCTRKICRSTMPICGSSFANLTTKGLRGAVGTAASYEHLLDGSGQFGRDRGRTCFERSALQAREISTQTYPRKLDYLLLSGLAGLGASLSKFAADVRVLSSPEFGEVAEPFGRKQVGSSAMPFKRNPILCERIDSLARLLVGYSDMAWQNAATNLLERTLDDSANRRTILPEALLCADEIVALARRAIDGLRVNERRIAAEPADVRAVCRHRGGDDGGGALGRRSPGASRSDSPRVDGVVGGARARARQSALATARRESRVNLARRPGRDSPAARSGKTRGHGAERARAGSPIGSRLGTFPATSRSDAPQDDAQ